MPWTVIVNPAAGRGRTSRLLTDLAAAASAVGAKLEISPDPAGPERIAREAAAAGHDLVACGGDGVVSVVAGVAADTDRRLAVVPTGAGNDFARVLGYDTKAPLRAFDTLANGRDLAVDLGRVNGRWYTCVTAAGFDAEVNRWANTVKRVSGTTLYVGAVLRTLAVYKPHAFRITVDGAAHETRAWLVAVGNGPAYGGGMRVTPDADLHDGLLDVTVVGDLSRFGLLRTFPRVFGGTHVRHPNVTTYRGARIEVETIDAPAGDVYADGERVSPLPATMEAVRNALTVRVP